MFGLPGWIFNSFRTHIPFVSFKDWYSISWPSTLRFAIVNTLFCCIFCTTASIWNKKSINTLQGNVCAFLCMYAHTWMCVCVWEREKDRQPERSWTHINLLSSYRNIKHLYKARLARSSVRSAGPASAICKVNQLCLNIPTAKISYL